ncbi:hypothetical protein C8R43DRAFT_960289 [Mycena crocata]|nr:hypothetical protein C8R43DRAFT_960289 [Mycena crocata]
MTSVGGIRILKIHVGFTVVTHIAIDDSLLERWSAKAESQPGVGNTVCAWNKNVEYLAAGPGGVILDSIARQSKMIARQARSILEFRGHAYIDRCMASASGQVIGTRAAKRGRELTSGAKGRIGPSLQGRKSRIVRIAKIGADGEAHAGKKRDSEEVVPVVKNRPTGTIMRCSKVFLAVVGIISKEGTQVEKERKGKRADGKRRPVTDANRKRKRKTRSHAETGSPRVILEKYTQHIQIPETLEHIALECDASGAKLIWNLTQQLWEMKYPNWPRMNWGLILGCRLDLKRTGYSPLFAMLISTSWHLIWNIRNDQVLKNPDKVIMETEIHNKWLKSVNDTLKRDRILINKIKFGKLAFNKDLVLRT